MVVTVFAWFSPWLWPGWPAVTVMQYLALHFDYDERPYAVRAAIIVGVMILNIVSWAAVAYIAWRAAERIRRAA
jgi:hypothetical protein